MAPERVRASRPLQPQAGLVAGAFNTMSPALASQIRRAWELLDSRWNQWVMGYSRTLVIVYGLFELGLGLTGLQPGVAHFAHLGGMLFGWLLIRYWRGQPPFGGPGRKPRMRIVR